MFTQLSILILITAVLFSSNLRFLSMKRKKSIAILGLAVFCSVYNLELGVFIITNILLLKSLEFVKSKKTRIAIYFSILSILFHFNLIGVQLNTVFTTFFFTEKPYLEHIIYCFPFILYGLNYLYSNTELKVSFNKNDFLKLVVYLFFFCAIAYPIEYTFGKFQSLNFFQALIILLAYSITLFIAKRIYSLFIDINSTFKNNLPVLFFLSVLICSPTLFHIILGILILFAQYLNRSNNYKIITTILFFLYGLFFIDSQHDLIIVISGLFSWPSIFLYFNELYILNSIGADITYYVPLLILFIAWLKFEQKELFNLVSSDQSVKKIQLLVLSFLIIAFF